MKLAENPIFLTHKRLVHRGGVLAAVIIAGLIGFSLLLGLVSSLRDEFHAGNSMDWAGKTFYGWILGVEILVLVIGGFSRISRTLSEDRKAGLWDSNRLTPLKPAQIIAGYWLAPALREFYMGAVLAGFGLLIVLTGHLPVSLWLGTQTLIAGTALFFGLLGLLAGMAIQRSQGILILLLVLVAYPFSFMAPSRMLTNFLLPIYGIGNLFQTGNHNLGRDWSGWPEIFGLPIQPILLSLGLQMLIGIFIWRVLLRKAANPFQPLLLRWEAASLFTILVVAQHGLLWDLWHGHFPVLAASPNRFSNNDPLLPVVHGGAMAVGILLLALASPAPEHIRVESLRLGFKNLGAIYTRSAVSLALMLSLVAALALFTQFVVSLSDSIHVFLVTAINLGEVFLVFALLLEFCRLRHHRRALGFVALWLFILCIIPFILAGVFSNQGFAKFSLLSPGFVALADSRDQTASDWNFLYLTELFHLAVITAFFLAWRREWKRLVTKAA